MSRETQKLNAKRRNGSYQSISNNSDLTPPPPDDGLTVRPMEYLTQQTRSHRRMIFCLAAFFLLAVLALTCWTLAFEWREQREAEAKHYDNSDEIAERRKRQEQIQASEQALHLINHHHHRQSAVVPLGCETTVLLIRHCDKPGRRVEDDGHCSAIGYERAEFLPTLFLGNHSRWPTPSRLYALTTERKHHTNYRAWETLLPLAEQIQQQKHRDAPTNSNSTAEAKGSSMIQLVASPTQLVETLWLPQLQTGHLCGMVSVVAWKHSHMVALANTFGCGPRQGCPSFFSSHTFDAVWELTFAYTTTSSATPNGSSNATTTGWHVFGTVLEQDFDPLEYRYEQGELYSDDADNVSPPAKHHHHRRHKTTPKLTVNDDAEV